MAVSSHIPSSYPSQENPILPCVLDNLQNYPRLSGTFMAYELDASNSPRERRNQYIFGDLDHLSQHHEQLSTHTISFADDTHLLKPYEKVHQWPSLRPGYQVCLRLLISTTTSLITAALSYVIVIRDSTKASRHLDAANNNMLSWPVTVWMHPSFMLLGTACFCVLVNLLFFVAKCVHAS